MVVMLLERPPPSFFLKAGRQTSGNRGAFKYSNLMPSLKKLLGRSQTRKPCSDNGYLHGGIVLFRGDYIKCIASVWIKNSSFNLKVFLVIKPGILRSCQYIVDTVAGIRISELQIVQKVTAFGTFTATTPSPHMIGGNASGIAGGTAQAAATAGTDASANAAGTKTALVCDGFNNLNGWLWVPTPSEYIYVTAGLTVTLAMIGTATTLTNWCAGLTFEEMN